MEEQLSLVTTSGRPFELIDVRVVGEDGHDIARGTSEVGACRGGSVCAQLPLCGHRTVHRS